MTNRNKAVLSVLAVFLLGALSGGTLVYLLILPDSSTPAAARDGRPPRESRQKAVERLTKDLNLDAKQQVQVDQIFQNARRESHEAFKVIGAGIQRKMKEVLSPEQFAKFEKGMRERRPPGGDRERPRSPDDAPQR